MRRIPDSDWDWSFSSSVHYPGAWISSRRCGDKLRVSEEILWTTCRCQGYRGPTGRLRDNELRQGAKGIEDP